jgi:positive regulator of sigma E activity
VESVGAADVALRFESACAGCQGCAGRCRSFRLYETGVDTLTLPRHWFPEDVTDGQEVLVEVADAELSRWALRAHGSAVGGLLVGALAAGFIAAVAGWQLDLAVLFGAAAGLMAGLRAGRSAPRPRIEIKPKSRG